MIELQLDCDAQVVIAVPSSSAAVGGSTDATIAVQDMKFALVLTNEPHVTKPHCCDDMTTQVNLQSLVAASPLSGTTDKRIYWSPVFNEYGLICQPSPEVLPITHCPFCGVELPVSRREEWLRKLESTGWQTWGDPIPARMLSSDWDAA
jgi:hypothetical protein